MGSPAGGTIPKEQVDSWPTVTYPQVFRPFRVVCDGTVYYPHVDHDPTVQMYIRYARDGTVRDTVLVPDFEGLPAGSSYAVALRLEGPEDALVGWACREVTVEPDQVV